MRFQLCKAATVVRYILAMDDSVSPSCTRYSTFTRLELTEFCASNVAGVLSGRRFGDRHGPLRPGRHQRRRFARHDQLLANRHASGDLRVICLGEVICSRSACAQLIGNVSPRFTVYPIQRGPRRWPAHPQPRQDLVAGALGTRRPCAS